MKAALIKKHGEASALQIADVPTPKLGANEVLVRLHAAAVNYVDIWVRKGGPAYPVALPHVPGADGAGIVEDQGAEVEGISKGDRVLIMPGLSCGTCPFCKTGRDNQCDKFEILGAKRHGTYAEFVKVPDQNVLMLPDDVKFETAAAFPLAYLTAWHMLVGRAKLVAGETVLISGASSGVAVAAIQIAKAKGARVLAVTTSEDKVDRIKSLGADEVYVMRGKEGFSEWALEQSPRGVEVVFEHVGPATWEHSLKSAARYGRLVTCGATSGPSVPLELRSLFSRDVSILGCRMGTQKEFQDMSHLVFDGSIKPVIDQTFPLDKAADAHVYVENRHQVGKVLLTIA